MPRLGALDLVPAGSRPDLLADPVRRALEVLPWADEVLLTVIDPALADTAAMSEAYDVPLEVSANCVVVMGRRAGEERTAACLVRADTRADVNSVVKRLLDVRKCSFLDHDRAVTETGMEHGGITPVGLPGAWRLLVDDRVPEVAQVLVGSGVRGSKLVLPGHRVAELAGAELVAGLAG